MLKPTRSTGELARSITVAFLPVNHMNILKSIGAVFVGMLFIIVTHTATDMLLESLGVFPPADQGLHDPKLLILATIYRSIFSIIGCYIAAKLAPSRPMLHALIIGFIGIVEHRRSRCCDADGSWSVMVSDIADRAFSAACVGRRLAGHQE
jgi:hypothetical protein